MKKYGDRIKKIMYEERKKTAKTIDNLPSEIHEDTYAIFGVIQDAINNWIGQQDRAIDGRLLHLILGIMSDEAQRIFDRLDAEGLLFPRTLDDDH